jgi:transposase, IS5 family
MLRTYGDQVTLWEAVLPDEVRRLSVELARVDRVLDDEAFFAPFVPFFHPRCGRPSTPMETYLRLSPNWRSPQSTPSNRTKDRPSQTATGSPQNTHPEPARRPPSQPGRPRTPLRLESLQKSRTQINSCQEPRVPQRHRSFEPSGRNRCSGSSWWFGRDRAGRRRILRSVRHHPSGSRRICGGCGR